MSIDSAICNAGNRNKILTQWPCPVACDLPNHEMRWNDLADMNTGIHQKTRQFLNRGTCRSVNSARQTDVVGVPHSVPCSEIDMSAFLARQEKL